MRLIIAGIFMAGGLFFFFVGTLGLLRFSDVMTRVHSAAKCDTLGTLLCITALIIYAGFSFASLKLLLVIIFLWITNPTATHLIAKAEISNRGNASCDASSIEIINLDEVEKNENI